LLNVKLLVHHATGRLSRVSIRKLLNIQFTAWASVYFSIFTVKDQQFVNASS
jgi:hypothetical protein